MHELTDALGKRRKRNQRQDNEIFMEASNSGRESKGAVETWRLIGMRRHGRGNGMSRLKPSGPEGDFMLEGFHSQSWSRSAKRVSMGRFDLITALHYMT